MANYEHRLADIARFYKIWQTSSQK